MTDRELLELAAKAAGYGEIIFKNGLDDDGYDDGIWTYTWIRSNKKLVDWNPLTDDGDALRLAVKLNLHTGLEDLVANVWQGGMNHWQTVPHNGDPYAATRRAIVRAAAEIGKSMRPSVSPGETATLK